MVRDNAKIEIEIVSASPICLVLRSKLMNTRLSNQHTMLTVNAIQYQPAALDRSTGNMVKNISGTIDYDYIVR